MKTGKYRWLLQSSDACLNDVLEYISKSLLKLCNVFLAKSFEALSHGTKFKNARGESVMLLPMLFIWLGDQDETNSLAGVYNYACKRCYWPHMDRNFNIIPRTKERSQNDYYKLYSMLQQPGQKQQAYEVAKELKQHIYPVSSYYLCLTNVDRVASIGLL
jgi:hypothetical protein